MPKNSGPSETGKLIPFAYPETLSDPDRLLAAYFSSPTVGLGILDSELRYLVINNKLAEINGTPAPAHLGKTVRQIMGDNADLIEPEFRRVLSTGEPATFEVSAVLPTRSEIGRWIIHCFPIQDVPDLVTRIGAMVIDIVEWKKPEHSDGSTTRIAKSEIDRLQLLSDVGSLLSSNWDIKIFSKVSARIHRVLRQEYTAFSLRDENTGLLVRQAEDFPLGRGLTSAVRITSTTSPSSRAQKERSPLILSQGELESFDAEITGEYLAKGLKSLCGVPLLRPNGPLGMLIFGSTRKDAFRHEDPRLLSQIASQFAFALENHRSSVEIASLRKRLAAEKKHLERQVHSQGPFAEIIGVSLPLKHVLDEVATVAGTGATVLILGETGTGKELIARALHRASTRRDRDFLKLNCAAIPTGLLESELFGHEKGAFTGAIRQKIGRMELADGGTLFLDEVGEIPLELQPKLLRALEDQEFERLGGTRTIKVDIRLVAATNRDLARCVDEQQFRSDLYYRLNVFPIRMPPLRERTEDIPLLVRNFVRKFAERLDRDIKTVSEEAMNALTEWSWPGNVRELENLMERSVILSEGPALYVPLLELRAEESIQNSQPNQSLDNAGREHIIRVLRNTRGILSGPQGAAAQLGLRRTTLQSRMRRLGINRKDYQN